MRYGTPGQRFFIIDYEMTGLDQENDDPIEVGIIVTDERFNAIDSLNSLIIPSKRTDDGHWTNKQLHAFRVHGIHPDEFEKGSLTQRDVAFHIHELAFKHKSQTNQKPVLVSDNIQFEWSWTKHLLKQVDGSWPFHYCGWDSSLLLEVSGVGDPKPVHRAFADAGLLHAAILKAIERTRK